jgi:hypothetical protein
MASTFSPSLRIELIGNGDQSGTWGTTTNNNLGTLIEQGITGVQSIVMANANYTLSNFNGISDEARNAVLVVSGTNGAIRQIICPLVNKTYIVSNNTTGGFAITIGGATGSTVSIPNGVTAQVYCDGINFFSSQTGSAGNFAISGNLSVSGTTALSGALTGTTGVFSGAISSVSPAFTGVPTAPTAAAGTNTTQIATTAFVLANGVPTGAIIMWSGSIASIPSGWLLCNGSSGTPDLRDRFVVGAGTTYAVAATGGSANAVVVSHTHTADTASLTGAITGVSFQFNQGGSASGVFTKQTGSSTNGGPVDFISRDAGQATLDASHTHTINTAGVSGTNANLPPYYALAYIMKA